MTAVCPGEMEQPAARDGMKDVAVERPFEETEGQVCRQEGEQEGEPSCRELTRPDLREKEPEGDQEAGILADHLDAEPENGELFLRLSHVVGTAGAPRRRALGRGAPRASQLPVLGGWKPGLSPRDAPSSNRAAEHGQFAPRSRLHATALLPQVSARCRRGSSPGGPSRGQVSKIEIERARRRKQAFDAEPQRHTRKET